VRRFSELKRSDRLRATGWLILAAGFISTVAFYVLKVRSADAALDDATALGYTRSMHHQIGVMMGQTVLMAICVALLAAYFFRVAWVLDQEEQN
jgi:hypothetical protein